MSGHFRHSAKGSGRHRILRQLGLGYSISTGMARGLLSQGPVTRMVVERGALKSPENPLSTYQASVHAHINVPVTLPFDAHGLILST